VRRPRAASLQSPGVELRRTDSAVHAHFDTHATRLTCLRRIALTQRCPACRTARGKAGGLSVPRLVHGGHRGVERGTKVDRVAPERRRAEAPAGGQDHRGTGRQRRQQACGVPGIELHGTQGAAC